MTLTIYAREGRDNNFHLLRHLAAMAVVLTHSFSVVTGEYAAEPLVSWVGKSIGHYAVDVFFVLSGFLIAQSLCANPDLIRFAVSRTLRIFPALAVAVVLASLALGPVVSTLDPHDYFSAPTLASYIVGTMSTLNTVIPLPGVFETLPEGGVVNAPLWTLRYELTAYASIAVIWTLTISFGGRLLAFTGAVLALAYLAEGLGAAPLGSDSFLHNTLHLLATFYVGAAAFLLRRSIPLSLPGVLLLAALAVITGPTHAGELTEKAFIGYLVLWLAFVPLPGIRRLERLGDFSYGIYIYAFPIQQVLRLAFPAITPLEVFIFTLLLCLPIAIASWHLIELPSLSARDRISRFLRLHLRRRAPPPLPT